MNGKKRLLQTIRLCTILSDTKRTQYYHDKKIFHSMGDNCLIMGRKVPLYAKLISIGNNVKIASNVHFNTHDVTHSVLNNMSFAVEKNGGEQFAEKIGCIEIGDNVFVGAGTSINYDVRIGSNVIIGACSLVTKDIPDNVVVGGVPARVLCTFDQYLEKRISKNWKIEQALDQSASGEIENIMWEDFYKKRNENINNG